MSVQSFLFFSKCSLKTIHEKGLNMESTHDTRLMKNMGYKAAHSLATTLEADVV